MILGIKFLTITYIVFLAIMIYMRKFKEEKNYPSFMFFSTIIYYCSVALITMLLNTLIDDFNGDLLPIFFIFAITTSIFFIFISDLDIKIKIKK